MSGRGGGGGGGSGSAGALAGGRWVASERAVFACALR